MAKSQNPSSIRSRKRIIDALLRLMQKKKYEAITITELAHEAQIVRKTFYHHFYTLDDVLEEYVENLLDEYIEMLKEAHIQNIYEHLPLYFKFWQTHFHFLEVLHQNDRLIFVLKKYDAILPKLYSLLPCPMDKSSLLFDYFTAYSSGAFWKLLCRWVERGGKESPEEMADIFHTFLTTLSSTSPLDVSKK